MVARFGYWYLYLDNFRSLLVYRCIFDYMRIFETYFLAVPVVLPLINRAE